MEEQRGRVLVGGNSTHRHEPAYAIYGVVTGMSGAIIRRLRAGRRQCGQNLWSKVWQFGWRLDVFNVLAARELCAMATRSMLWRRWTCEHAYNYFYHICFNLGLNVGLYEKAIVMDEYCF